jgi:hypothetical protein
MGTRRGSARLLPGGGGGEGGGRPARAGGRACVRSATSEKAASASRRRRSPSKSVSRASGEVVVSFGRRSGSKYLVNSSASVADSALRNRSADGADDDAPAPPDAMAGVCGPRRVPRGEREAYSRRGLAVGSLACYRARPRCVSRRGALLRPRNARRRVFNARAVWRGEGGGGACTWGPGSPRTRVRRSLNLRRCAALVPPSYPPALPPHPLPYPHGRYRAQAQPPGQAAPWQVPPP